jgi:hypothetical protein
MTSTMRPGQIKPNDFELAIRERLARKEPSLRGAVGQLHVLSREFTGVGSYTNFVSENRSAETPDKQIILDDVIMMPGVPNGMGAVLFCKGDRPNCLEVFTYGDDHRDCVYDGFTIEQTA